MSRRARALVFLLAALICAALAAGVAGRYRSRVEARYGPLQPVVVAVAELPAGEPIGLGEARSGLTLRRIPARFVPQGALTTPAEALGRAPAVSIPAGSYLLAAQLTVPHPERPHPADVSDGLRPVEVTVAGAEALTVAGGPPEGSSVDVVVSRQAGLGKGTRAQIAASGVRLLALRSPASPGEGWSATLAVSEAQALALIGAESSGREIRLLPRG